MTREEFASGLDGRNINNVITPFETQRAIELHYAVIFVSDKNNCLFRGAITGCCDLRNGNKITHEMLPSYIEVLWREEHSCWDIETPLPSSPFRLLDENEVMCHGVVIDLNECNLFATSCNYEQPCATSSDPSATCLQPCATLCNQEQLNATSCNIDKRKWLYSSLEGKSTADKVAFLQDLLNVISEYCDDNDLTVVAFDR